MNAVTNNNDIPLGLAVWVLHDDYDHQNIDNYISATRLMKPLRHIILPPRVPQEDRTADVEDFIASGLGRAIHDSIEKAWINGYERSLALMGYPTEVIKRVLINPTKEQLAATKDPIPVYLEQRTIRTIVVNGIEYAIGGKYDMVADGMVQDNKSTTAYTWVYGGKDDDYQLQGSIYRWLNPEIIKEDFIRINFIFTDWQRASAAQNPKYPPRRLMSKDIPLLSLADTEKWIHDKIAQIQRYRNVDESRIPLCTDEELWRSEPQYKYYSDPTKTTGRSTKNFDNPSDARKFQAEKGGKGIIITVPGVAKRCEYCDAASICSQRKQMTND